MLYVFYGNDFDKVREIARKTAKVSHRFNGENWSESEFDQLVQSKNLFGEKQTTILNRVFENSETKEHILRNLEEIALSENLFILLEEKIDKVTLTKLSKQAEKMEAFSKSKEKKQEEFSIFSLAYALANKDKRKMWTLYQRARRQFEPEAIHGVLWWKVKSTPQLWPLSSKLVSIYHDAHRGLVEFDLALEKFILEI